VPRARPDDAVIVAAAGREVRITHPDKVWFPEVGVRKRDVVAYFEAVAEGALRAARDRPVVLVRYVHGVGAKPFFQKRAPDARPDWVDTVTFRFPSGRTAEEVVIRDLAQLLWTVNLGCLELHTHPVRADDLDHPDELRLDLDPVPGVPWSTVVEVALALRDLLGEHGLVAWPKTSGSRGMHLLVRIARRWTFEDVRRAALALAREAERRLPGRASARWWKEEREGVFVDYNQNARDRTTAAAWSVRPLPATRVSMPLRWEEVPGSDPARWTLDAAVARHRSEGDAHAGIDARAGSLASLLRLAAQQEATLGDAPWPPHFAKAPGEPRRVAPSRAKGAKTGGRRPSAPLVLVARSPDEDAALAGLERWKARHPDVVPHLQPRHVLVDRMRGRSSTWTRIRVNLADVPARLRPSAEPPDPDDVPSRAPKPAAARKPRSPRAARPAPRAARPPAGRRGSRRRACPSGAGRASRGGGTGRR
jgi:DNA ligase D-like protein (predicted polymerase)